MTPDELDALIDVPFTFDMLRDEAWRPTREDYRSLRDTAENLARDHAALRRWAEKARSALHQFDVCERCMGDCATCVLNDDYPDRDGLLAEYDEKWGTK